jgi:hypothetical protein
MASIHSQSASTLPGLPGNNAQENISLSLSSCSGADATDIVVKITPPAEGTRTATDVCAVVDVSGSMGTETQNGDAESQGLSVLDIVKHACKTVIHSLTEQDRFCLVAYSSQATVKLELTVMDEAGKERASTEVDNLHPGGQTNLWDGLHAGLQVLNDGADATHMAAVLLLTDGQPNVIPPRGHVPMLQQYKDEHDLICSISTFGFGYNLDSALLQELAIEGQGQYAFIPDGSFVGTAFVNATSNILSTAARQLVLKLSNVGDVDGVDVLGYSKTLTKASWGLQIPLGSITFGQAKDVVLRVPAGSSAATSGGAGIRADLDYMLVTPDRHTAFVEGTSDGAFAENGGAQAQSLRAQFVTKCRDAVEHFKAGNHADAQQLMAGFSAQVKAAASDAASADDQQALTDLAADCDGQVTEALSRGDWFNKWGKHYLPSLVNAHHLQQCNNFKDPGVQHYGGPLFLSLRDTAEQVFLKLPPPTPTARRSNYGGYGGYGGGGGGSAAPAAPVDMSAYYNAGGGCFTGSSRVLMADGVTHKRTDELRAGDRVATAKVGGQPGSAAVRYVVETKLAPGDATLLVTLPGGLQITAWHPVHLEGCGGWTFPAHIAAAGAATAKVHDASEVGSVFNLVLEKGATHAVVEGLPTISLGHGIQGDAVASHAYYGSEQAVSDLEQHFGVAEGGRIVVPAGQLAAARGEAQADENGHMMAGTVTGVARRSTTAMNNSKSSLVAL